MTQAAALGPRMRRSQRQWRCFTCGGKAPAWAIVIGSQSRYVVFHEHCAERGMEELSQHLEAWHSWSGEE